MPKRVGVWATLPGGLAAPAAHRPAWYEQHHGRPHLGFARVPDARPWGRVRADPFGQ